MGLPTHNRRYVIPTTEDCIRLSSITEDCILGRKLCKPCHGRFFGSIWKMVLTPPWKMFRPYNRWWQWPCQEKLCFPYHGEVCCPGTEDYAAPVMKDFYFLDTEVCSPPTGRTLCCPTMENCTALADCAVARDSQCVDPGREDCIAPGRKDCVSPRSENYFPPGRKDCVSPRSENCFAPGRKDCVSPRTENCFDPGRKDCVSPGRENCVAQTVFSLAEKTVLPLEGKTVLPLVGETVLLLAEKTVLPKLCFPWQRRLCCPW
jgi:hypothetical protein